MGVLVNDKQSILDVAIQHLGSAAAAFSLAFTNGISITDDLVCASELNLSAVVSPAIVTYYADKKIVPATAITITTEEQARIFDETFDETFE